MHDIPDTLAFSGIDRRWPYRKLRNPAPEEALNRPSANEVLAAPKLLAGFENCSGRNWHQNKNPVFWWLFLFRLDSRHNAPPRRTLLLTAAEHWAGVSIARSVGTLAQWSLVSRAMLAGAFLIVHEI